MRYFCRKIKIWRLNFESDDYSLFLTGPVAKSQNTSFATYPNYQSRRQSCSDI